MIPVSQSGQADLFMQVGLTLFEAVTSVFADFVFVDFGLARISFWPKSC